MPVFPPGDTTILDRFDRSDGTVYAGAGATLWDDVDMAGDPSALTIQNQEMHVTTGGSGGLTNENLTDFIRGIRIVASGGGFGPLFGFRLTGSGATLNGYAWQPVGGTLNLLRYDNGVATTISSVSISPGVDVTARVAWRSVGDTHEFFLTYSRVFSTTPVHSFTDATHASGAIFIGAANTGWVFDDYFAGGLTAPTEPVTIHVDPDHPDASDLRTRTEASDPDTPMRTVDEACWLARSDPAWDEGDTILVHVCETEDLGDDNDPHIQPLLDYRSVADRSAGAAGWPFGDNTGNPAITIKGNVSEDHGFEGLPKIHKFMSRGLSNWVAEDIQWGYDRDSGFDYMTFSYSERVIDQTWRRCLFTAGIGVVEHWAGEYRVEDCRVHSPLSPPQNGVHDGCGLRLEDTPGEGTGTSAGDLFVLRSEFNDIQGDDAITAFRCPNVLVQDCTFLDVVEGNPVYHTDSVQTVECGTVIVNRNVFEGCSDALIASDGRHTRIEFTRNLTVGMNTPLQIQGTDELLVAHNTFNHADSAIKDASILLYSRTALPSKTVATIVNNIIGGFFMRDEGLDDYFGLGTVIENNIVMTSPGLVSDWGTNLPGIAEFGHSARLDVLPDETVTLGTVNRYWELANSPDEGPGIAQGQTTDLTTDFFGRAFADPPDVGCFQSDPGTLVAPVARSPYVTARYPTGGATGVPVNASVTVTLYPKPGQTIAPATVTTSSAYLTSPYGVTVPAVVTVGDPDENAQQAITLNFKYDLETLREGYLGESVAYTAHLTSAIKDTEGSALPATSWSFTIVGPSGPPIYLGDGPGDSWVVGYVT